MYRVKSLSWLGAWCKAHKRCVRRKCLQKLSNEEKNKIGTFKGGYYSSKPGCAAGSQAICDEKLRRVASMGGRLIE